MIGYLKGTIKFKQENSLIVDVNNVGYLIFVPDYVWQATNFHDLREFYIYTQVREDAINLFGFSNKEDKQIFMQLISVPGIGPKTALKIVSSAGGSHKIIKAIQDADVDFFNSIKGTGKKTSQKIIIELKNKVGGLKDLDLASEANEDLVNALKELGFNFPEIKKAIKNINKNLPLEKQIKKALQNQNASK